MKPINTNLITSSLSFGCAKVGGSVSEKKSLIGLETAFEEGVVQYDVARSYGFGDAERVLGKFIHDKRQDVCVTTKFGIEPPPKSTFINLAKPLARYIIKQLPFAKKTMQQVASVTGATMMQSKFNAAYAMSCIEKSLRELKTDYIDMYLLHSCSYEDTLQDELFNTLRKLEKEGKIRAFGVSVSYEIANQVMKNNVQKIKYFQFESSLLHNNLLKIENNKDSDYFIFANAPFEQGNVEKYILGKIQQNPKLITAFLNNFGVDLSDEKQRNSLILQSALSSNSQGVVICTMLNPIHIKENVKNTKSVNFTLNQIRKINELLGIL